jgi:hypothetical protein
VLKFKGLQVLMKGVGNFSYYEGSRVLNLLLGRESLGLTAVSAVWAIAGRRTFDASAGRNFEVTEAFLDRTFTPQVAVCIGFQRNAELIAKPSEIVHAEQPVKWVAGYVEWSGDQYAAKNDAAFFGLKLRRSYSFVVLGSTMVGGFLYVCEWAPFSRAG